MGYVIVTVIGCVLLAYVPDIKILVGWWLDLFDIETAERGRQLREDKALMEFNQLWARDIWGDQPQPPMPAPKYEFYEFPEDLLYDFTNEE